jgi:hypothetical protein
MRRTATAAKRQRVKDAEQRREPRDTGKGDISLVFADTNATSGVREVYGRLIDHSARGFRAVHEFRGLTCGQMVQFRAPASSEGRARVVWTRIAGGRVETGFFIVT